MISQEKLATILNVSMVTVSRWERGVSKPSQMAMKTLVKKGVLACLKS
jgi:DNA-binding transcriptional regulator YiaG